MPLSVDVSFIQSNNTRILQINCTSDFRKLNYIEIKPHIYDNSKAKAAVFDLGIL